MAEQTRKKQASKTGTASLEFDEFELHSTMQEFLKEEEKESGKGIWNVATISGMVMLFMAFTFAIQTIGVPVGEFLGGLAEMFVGSTLMPLIGGALITLVGFGFLVGDRKRVRKNKKARKKAKQSKSQATAYTDIHGSESDEWTENPGLRNDLDSSSKSSSKSSTSFKDFGYRHSKRLMKSRSNKKWAGVCGGLAKYFGISATVVRFIFVAAFFMGYGSSLLIYFGLSLAMPKEPIEMMDDFDY